MAWYSHLGAFSGVTWHAGVVSGSVWWGLSTAVMLRTRLATAVTWRAVGDGGDVALAAAVTWQLVSMKTPSLGPFGHLRGGRRRWLGGGMVVVGGIGVMGQCLAMGGCQTLKLLIINILIFN